MWQKCYHPSYDESFNELDHSVRGFVRKKEDYIAESPESNGSLHHTLKGIHRYKNPKVRILYAMSTERGDMWPSRPASDTVMFLYVDLRNEETYDAAYKVLKKHGVIA